MKYVSIFSGIEAATVAWHPLGWEPLAFSEIDPFPSTVLQHHYPNVPNLGDITKIDWNPYKGQADLVVGGSPCFPSGTLILTSERLKPIEEVKVGDMVLTHLNRWRRVIQTGSKISDTIVLKGQGVSSLECTPNHPFWSTGKTKNKHLGIRQLEEPKWLEAENMPGRMWLNMNATGACLPIPDPNETEAHVRISLSTPFFYFVGRWLGDGWANSHKRKNRINSNMKRVYVCCAHELADDLEKKLEDTGLHFGRVVAFASNQHDEVRELEVAGALAAQPGIKQQTYICRADGQTNAMTSVNLAPTLTSHAKKDPPLIYPAEDEPVTLQIHGGKPGGGKGALIQRATLSTHNIQTPITGGREKRGLTVRRLTPRECERLQGFPDDYTDIPYRNKEHAPDGPRYKALGNSMAVPVMRWIGERIRTVEEAAETTD